MTIYHIALSTDWKKAKDNTDFYQCESLQTEGFIHCSTREQIIPVANRFYKGMEGLILLKIDDDKVEAEIKYENLEGGDELFPHIYGTLNLDAVIMESEFTPEADGYFTL